MKLIDWLRKTQVVVRPPGYEDPARGAARVLVALIREADTYSRREGDYVVISAAKWHAVMAAAKEIR